MKLKPGTMGLALAGAVALCAAMPAEAQQKPAEPYYFTPKLLYSHTMTDSFETDTKVYNSSEFSNSSVGRFNGGDKNDDSFGGGLSIGYDFGAYSEYPVRLELEYLHHGSINTSYPTQSNLQAFSDYSSNFKIKSTIQTVMANAYLDFPTDTAFTPYIGGGIGGAYVDSKLSGNQYLEVRGKKGAYRDGEGNYAEKTSATDGVEISHYYPYRGKMSGDQNSWNFAWQLSAGFSYQITDSMALDLSYRYSDYGSADFGTKGYTLNGKIKADDFIDNSDPTQIVQGTNSDDQVLGKINAKAKYDLSSHEVILGLRIMAF